MPLIQEQVTVEEKTRNVSKNIVKFISDIKAVVDDGWQPGQDIPAIIQAAFLDLVPSIKEVGNIGAEWKESSSACLLGLHISEVELAKALGLLS